MIAVTVLTSLDQATLQTEGESRRLVAHDGALGRLADAAAGDGVGSSVQEALRSRSASEPVLLSVTPGIRPSASRAGGTKTDDQARTLTAAQAIAAGASLLVVGRFFFSSRRRHTRCLSDWSSDVCSSD